MTRATSKAGRLLLLYLLREAGVLDDEVKRSDVARWLGVDRSTITKDLHVMADVLASYAELQASQPWVRRFYSTSEAAEQLGLDYDTVLAMIAGDVIHGEREGRGQWRVSVAEVDRWKGLLES